MKKVSICMLTIDRYLMSRYTIETFLKNAGHNNIELLILDNGSRDRRIIDYGKSVANIHIEQAGNIGVARGFNKLFREATGDYICLVGNDILLDKNWLRDLVHYNETIEKSGIGAIHCVLDKGKYIPLLSKDEKFVNVFQTQSHTVYGVCLFSKEILETVGGFDERFTKYGCEDSQLAIRVGASGYHNYYIPGQTSVHVGTDVGQKTEYRKNKDEELKEAQKILADTLAEMKKTRNYKIAL